MSGGDSTIMLEALLAIESETLAVYSASAACAPSTRLRRQVAQWMVERRRHLARLADANVPTPAVEIAPDQAVARLVEREDLSAVAYDVALTAVTDPVLRSWLDEALDSARARAGALRSRGRRSAGRDTAASASDP